MSTYVTFVPSTVTPFTFQPILNDQQYNAVVTWNFFGQRFYVTITDLLGVLVLCTAVPSSGPRLDGAFTWSGGTVTVQCEGPHEVPVGASVNILVSSTGTEFDGYFQALAVTETSLTYPLAQNPLLATPQNGVVNFALNLMSGTGFGWLYFWWNSNQYEYQDAPT